MTAADKFENYFDDDLGESLPLLETIGMTLDQGDLVERLINDMINHYYHSLQFLELYDVYSRTICRKLLCNLIYFCEIPFQFSVSRME